MTSKRSNILDPSNLFQIGIVVKSIDQTVKFWSEVFGIGPFEIREVNYPDATFYGERAGYRGKRAFAKLGPVVVELIEPIEGKTIHELFLREKGEGLNHIAFEVKNLKRCIENAEKAGLKVIQGMMREDGSGFAYLDSERIGGVIFELAQSPIYRP